MAAGSHHQEKRKYIRVDLDTYVIATLTVERSHTEKIFTSKNMSPEGVFLVSKESFPVGTVLSLTIHAPTSLHPFHTQAEVVRVAKDDKLKPIGMGLAFLKMSDSDKKELLKNLYLVYQNADKRDNE